MSKLTKKFHHVPYPSISPIRPELSTSGKTVLVTGASSGIGYACAEAFAQSGAKNIIITSRTAKTLEAAKEKLSSQYPDTTIHAIPTDISSSSDVAGTFTKVAQEIGPIDIFMANAGYAPKQAKIADMEIDDFRRGIETNLIGTFLCAQAFINQPSLSAVADPVFIHISTGHAHAPPQGPLSGYGVTKAAAAKVVDYLAAEEPGVRVYAVHPGAIETNMTRGLGRGRDYLREVPELPGQFCVWLCSEQGRFLRGRFLWASWDVDELVGMRGQFERDAHLGRVGLKFQGSRL